MLISKMLEELAIKLSEKESFAKSFLLFFTIIELFLGFIFYNYYKIESEHLQENLYMQMKNYSFFFDNDKFDIDFIPKTKNLNYYELNITSKDLYILTPIDATSHDVLKIYYPYRRYQFSLKQIRFKILWQFLLTSIISILISIGFSFYILKPLRESLQLLEVFIKDIIHDLNTPLTNILINLKIIGKNPSIQEEIDGIEQSAKTISMLHTNLNSYLQNFTYKQNRFNLKDTIKSQIDFFKPSYSYLKWDIDLDECIVSSDENAIARVIYNLISNACKYNTNNGFIKITLKENIVTIQNDSYGIKHPNRIFDRFYKENDRGLGIGLHIVERLCQELKIDKHLHINNNIFSITLNFN